MSWWQALKNELQISSGLVTSFQLTTLPVDQNLTFAIPAWLLDRQIIAAYIDFYWNKIINDAAVENYVNADTHITMSGDSGSTFTGDAMAIVTGSLDIPSLGTNQSGHILGEGDVSTELKAQIALLPVQFTGKWGGAKCLSTTMNIIDPFFVLRVVVI
jgi:hypothetical protein